ncbi:MAG: hypothetical protein JRN52_01985 [Nitrososphaerota archaeon]|nr:hypothetical protein [Nitrososphaerota archaeon]
MKFTISYKTDFGTISAESKKPEDLVDALDELKKIEKSIRESRKKPLKPARAISAGRGGRGETSVALKEIESSLLGTNFFSKPRTTGETRDKLHELTGKSFTSRKVSQALGILWKKKELSRSGSRNFFAYST